MGKSEPLYIAGGNVKQGNHFGKVWQFLKMFSIELPHDTTIPLLDIFPIEMKIYVHIKNLYTGTSLVVLWIRLHAPSAGGPGSIPDQGTRSHMHAATKGPTCCN